MPRIGYIYEIKSMDTSITEIYIGSCWDMRDRIRRHTSCCYNEKRVEYKFPVYKYIRENGDFHTFNMRVIDSGECEDETELRCAEQFYIDMAGGVENLLNCYDAIISPEETRKRNNIRTTNRCKKNIETKKYTCELCKTYCHSKSHLEIHLETKKHKKKLSSIEQSKNPEITIEII